MHWAERYIGLPWVKGAQGPEAFDCWGLVRHVQRVHFGIEIPEIAVDADDLRACIRAFTGHAERARWAAVAAPRPGDGVLLAHARHPVHAGVWLEPDGGGVLHAVRGAGVIYSSPSALRLSGWTRIEFYRFCGAAI